MKGRFSEHPKHLEKKVARSLEEEEEEKKGSSRSGIDLRANVTGRVPEKWS